MNKHLLHVSFLLNLKNIYKIGTQHSQIVSNFVHFYAGLFLAPMLKDQYFKQVHNVWSVPQIPVQFLGVLHCAIHPWFNDSSQVKMNMTKCIKRTSGTLTCDF